MTVNEVASLLGVSPVTVRVGLQQGKFPFGVAIKTDEKNKNYTYVFFPAKVKEYIGEGKNNG